MIADSGAEKVQVSCCEAELVELVASVSSFMFFPKISKRCWQEEDVSPAFQVWTLNYVVQGCTVCFG